MHFISRTLPLGAVLALTIASLAGCPPPANNTPDAGVVEEGCESARDCGQGAICDKEADNDGIPTADDEIGVCIQVLCLSDADCEDPINEKCDPRRGLCIPRNLCESGLDGDCPNDGDRCIYVGGLPICKAPDAAPECTLSPSQGYVSAGSTLQIEGVGNDASGKLIPQTTFTWATGGGTIDANGVLTAPTAAGDVTVTATANGGATCTSIVTVYGAVPNGDLRVVVIDQATREPLAGVKVAAKFGATSPENVTGADGSFTFAGGTAADAVSIFPDNNQWHTIINPPDDVIIYTSPTPAAAAEVDGVKGTFDFSAVHTIGDIKLGLAGTAINAAITDLNFGTIIGESIDTRIDIAGITAEGGQVVPLPEGLVIGLGDNLFKRTYSSINDKAGPSVAWALAGQIRLSEVGPIISEVAGDTDNINAGKILAAVLPFFATFDHAVVTGLDFDPAARQANDPNFDEVVLKPDTLISLSAELDMPKLPCAPGGFSASGCDVDLFEVVVAGVGDAADVSTIETACPSPLPGGTTCEAVSSYATGAVIISGSVIPGVGLVPLGLSAGLDDVSAAGNNFDGVVEQSGDSAPAAGKLLLDFAPPHDGIEGNRYLTVAIALDINSIASTSANDLGASIITQITRDLNGKTTNFAGNEFLQSQGGTFAPGAAGTFTLTKKGTADFYRVNLDDEGEAEWNVWFGNDTTGFNIADLPIHTGVAGQVAARTAHADVQAFGLGAGYDGPSPASFDDLFGFDGQDLDNLLYYLGRWSSESCKAGGICAAP